MDVALKDEWGVAEICAKFPERGRSDMLDMSAGVRSVAYMESVVSIRIGMGTQKMPQL